MRRAEASDHYAGPTVSEAQLKARVVELAHAAGWMVFSMPMVKNSRPIRNGASGYPDLTLARHRQVMWIELKTDTGKMSREQEAWFDALPDAYLVTPSMLHDGTLGKLLAVGHIEQAFYALG